MKRIIYTLTAIFSAAAAALLIIDYIIYVIESGEFYFNLYRVPLIAVLLALILMSVIQLKKHTPGVILVLCGYVFIASSGIYSYLGVNYLEVLLLMAAALTPAIYEFSHYSMMVLQEPKANGQGRWRWLNKAAIAVTVFRVWPFILQLYIDIRIDSNINISESYSTDIMGISALICFAVFCGLMSRRTSALYRMFFTGCILFDAVQTVFIDYSLFISHIFQGSMARTLFVFFEILYALFILLILIHAFLTKRDGMLPSERTDVMKQTETPAA